MKKKITLLIGFVIAITLVSTVFGGGIFDIFKKGTGETNNVIDRTQYGDEIIRGTEYYVPSGVGLTQGVAGISN